jgi:hypothetical protein
MRINSTDIDTFVRLEMIYAVLNENIEGVYITPNEGTRRMVKEKKVTA